MDYQSVLGEVESWPIEDRIRLVRDVSNRLADQDDSPVLSEEMEAELDRRIEGMDRNPEAGVPWAVAKARALVRFRR
jgi:putative addiction module component (TIGR02574 family)